MYKFAFFSFLAFFCHALPAEIAHTNQRIKMSDETQNMLQLIEAMLEGNEVDINTRDAQGKSLLMWAIYMEQKEAAYMLIQGGADVHVNVAGVTALTMAASRGYQDIVQLLLDVGADVNSKDRFGATALMVAAREWRTEAVKILLAAGADLNVQDAIGETALMKAARHGYQDIVQLLLESGADITLKNHAGQDAVYVAANGGKQEVMRMILIYSGANMQDPKVVRMLRSATPSKAPRRPADFFH